MYVRESSPKKSSFIYPRVFLNLYDFLYPAEHKSENIPKNVGNKTIWPSLTSIVWTKPQRYFPTHLPGNLSLFNDPLKQNFNYNRSTGECSRSLLSNF